MMLVLCDYALYMDTHADKHTYYSRKLVALNSKPYTWKCVVVGGVEERTKGMLEQPDAGHLGTMKIRLRLRGGASLVWGEIEMG